MAKWIKLKKRCKMPNTGDDVWVMHCKHGVRAAIYCAGSDWPWGGDGPSITHWMPRDKPEPPTK